MVRHFSTPLGRSPGMNLVEGTWYLMNRGIKAFRMIQILAINDESPPMLLSGPNPCIFVILPREISQRIKVCMFLGRVFVAVVVVVVVVVVLQSRQRATATSTMLGQTFFQQSIGGTSGNSDFVGECKSVNYDTLLSQNRGMNNIVLVCRLKSPEL